MEALGEWVTVMSTSAADRVCSGMGKLTGIVRGPSPPLPHDVSVLSDLIIDPATDSVTDTVAEDVAVAVTEHLTIPKRMTVSTRKLEGVGVVLTEARSELLREVLPIYMQDETLVLLYSILSHGSDMASFFSQSKGYPYSVIIIQACSGEIFGGFAAGMWKQANKYYGDGESFVFHFGKLIADTWRRSYIMLALTVDGETSVTPYRWNRSNDFFLWSDSSSVAMGGGGNGFAFMVSDGKQLQMHLKFIYKNILLPMLMLLQIFITA